MITAEKIRRLAYLTSVDIEQALRQSYPKDQVLQNRFLGITNGGDFCYEVLYYDNIEGSNLTTKVFVNINNDGLVVADY